MSSAFAFKNGRLVRREAAPVADCAGCAACCLYQGRPPLSAAEEAGLPDELRAELAAFDAGVAAGTRPPPGRKAREILAGRVGLTMFADADLVEPCLWLDHESRRCRHYGHRPAPCRAFEVGGKDCRATRQEFRIPLPLAG